LHFDVMSAWQELLEENRGVPESFESLSPRTLKCYGEVRGRPDFANASAAASRRGFNKDGVAQVFGVMESVGQGFCRTSAPGHDRDVRLLRKPLGGDLVADAAHGIAIWADEHNAHVAAEVGEGGMLGHEAPSHPYGFRARHAQSPRQVYIIHVAAVQLLGLRIKHMRGAEVHGLVSFANEHRIAVRVSEHRDGTQGYSVLLSELASRMNESHCGLTPVDDRHAFEFVVHIISVRQQVTSTAHTQAATSSSDIMVRSALN
jgi:hypothetical protein